jgi:cytochrome c-type biogenesis protein CcmH
MTQIHALIAIGSAVTVIAGLLMLLRIEVGGRRPVWTLTRRWVAASPQPAGIVLAMLCAVGASAFAAIPMQPRANAWSNTATPAPDQRHAVMDDDEDVAALRTYAAAIEKPLTKSEAESLPGVDEMIAKLVARLEKDPGDVKGWKMLGWSYLNTGRPGDAERAYGEARRLAPGDRETLDGWNAAKSAQNAPDAVSNIAPSPTGTAHE